MSYNGWTNYETWNVNLWLGNEEGSYNYWQEQARELGNVTDLASALESEIMDNAPELPGLYGDILTANLQTVNWREIAESMLGDIDEDDDDDSDDEEVDG